MHSFEHEATFQHAGTTVERYRLKNGLTLLFLPEPRAPVFSYQTWFRVGASDEQRGKGGLAHLFEHLMFKGTETTPEGEYDRRIESLGGRSNAATWLDWTFYHADLPAGHLEAIVALEADRLAGLAVTPAAFESEHKVVMNERRETVEDEPASIMSEVLWAMAFPTHPYGRPTIGFMADIEGLTLEDAARFRQRWYAPDNAVVVAAGDLSREALLETVARHYGALLPGQAERAHPAAEEPRKFPEFKELRLALAHERLAVGWPSPAVTDPDHAVLEVLNEVLFEGDSARLQRALVTEGELASGHASFVSGFRHPGLYEVSVELRPGRTAAEAEAVVLEEFARVALEGISEAELEKAKNRLETSFWRGQQTVQQRAWSLGHWEVTAGDFRHAFEVADRFAAVTREDVLRVAQARLRPELRVVVYGLPNGEVDEDEEGDEEEEGEEGEEGEEA
jgi:zinc protease